MITWKTINKKKCPEPKEGLDPKFDAANKAVEKAKEKLDEYLDEVKTELKMPEIKYFT